MDDEDYGFEYSDDDHGDDDTNIENQYYLSKELIETNVEDALAEFAQGGSHGGDQGRMGV